MSNLTHRNKLRGGYYTPIEIADFVASWVITSSEDIVLEPSCGDGVFLSSVSKKLKALGAKEVEIQKNVLGIELDPVEAQKASTQVANVICSDFFTYYKSDINAKKEFDAVVGNPPFIRYQNFDEEYRKVAFSLLKKHGFHPNRLTNIWLPFLVLSSLALKPNGRLGMVIPAELFQVDYAAETRLFLSEFFESLTIVTFRKLVFEGIQQEVVLLLGERTSSNKGIRIVELDDLSDLNKSDASRFSKAEIKELDHSADKWVKYYLSGSEIGLLKQLNTDKRISNANTLYEINVGLVSGENSFFVINKETADSHSIQELTVPIIGRSEQLKGLCLTTDDYKQLVAENKKVFLFAPGNTSLQDLPADAKKYIEWGESKGYHKNYKCRIRKNWYHVPQSWKPDAFLLRQVNAYPRMILNQKNALNTDTLHKTRFFDGVNGRVVSAAFLNAYTFALSETIGRSYGGGVLTFEPGEMRKMRIPMLNSEKLDFVKIDQWQRDGQIERILTYTDNILLHEGLGFSKSEVVDIHSIWIKLRDRRFGRKKANNNTPR